MAWQPTGVPALPSPHATVPADCGSRVASRARDLAIARAFGIPNRTAALPDDLLGADVEFTLCQRLPLRTIARLLRHRDTPARPRPCDCRGSGAGQFPFPGLWRRRIASGDFGNRQPAARSARARRAFGPGSRAPHPLWPARIDGRTRQPNGAVFTLGRQPLQHRCRHLRRRTVAQGRHHRASVPLDAFRMHDVARRSSRATAGRGQFRARNPTGQAG